MAERTHWGMQKAESIAQVGWQIEALKDELHTVNLILYAQISGVEEGPLLDEIKSRLGLDDLDE